jgi:hypothetical protein
MAARRGAFLPAGASINPAVLPYLALFPEPTVDNPTGERALYQGQFRQPSELDTYNVRLDFLASQNDSMFMRYTQNDSNILFLTAELFPTFPNRGENNQKFLTLSHQRIFSNNVVNSVRYAFNQTSPREYPAPTVNFNDLAFIPGQVVGDIWITGYRRFGSDRSTPRSYNQHLMQVADDLSIVRARTRSRSGPISSGSTFAANRRRAPAVNSRSTPSPTSSRGARAISSASHRDRTTPRATTSSGWSGRTCRTTGRYART